MGISCTSFSPLASSSVRMPAPPNPTKLTNHMAAMNPTVPKTRMGGKSFTVSKPLRLRIEKATVFDRAMVGM